jgi:hypothetical protein
METIGQVPGFKPPIAFTSADGADLGAIFADETGAGRPELKGLVPRCVIRNRESSFL